MTYTSPLPAQTRADLRGSSLELVDLTMAYGDIEVLRGVSIAVAPGTTTCVIGPSGSGKSTMLRGVNRLHEPKSGDVLLGGESILATKPDTLRRRIGLVFQHFTSSPITPPSRTSLWPCDRSRSSPGSRPSASRRSV